MSGYKAAFTTYVLSLLPGDQITLWSAEQPVVGISTVLSTSERVSFSRSPNAEAVKIAVDGFFSGAPGAFEIDVQGSETDTDAGFTLVQYPSVGASIVAALINAVDANNAFHAEFYISSKFARLAMKARANAVNVTATVRRA